MKSLKRLSPGALILLILFTCLLFAPAVASPHEKALNALIWVKYSDEYKFCCAQSYMDGSNRLKTLAKSLKPGTWCVVLDMDETIVSNVGYELEMLKKGLDFDYKLWNEWCARAEATPLPGAVEFARLARKMGGKVIVITNRDGESREGTLKNLKKIGFPFDACILMEGPYKKDKTKTERRKDLEFGKLQTLPGGEMLPPLRILMLAGDQEHDLFDSNKVSYQDALKRLEKDFIIIPNPIYGSWEDKFKLGIKPGKGDEPPMEVEAGQEFNIEMDSNPTTGYRWELGNPLDEKVLHLAGFHYIRENTALAGSGGKEQWTFKAVGPGRAKIQLQYVRPWEEDTPPAKEKTVEVIVK